MQPTDAASKATTTEISTMDLAREPRPEPSEEGAVQAPVPQRPAVAAPLLDYDDEQIARHLLATVARDRVGVDDRTLGRFLWGDGHGDSVVRSLRRGEGEGQEDGLGLADGIGSSQASALEKDGIGSPQASEPEKDGADDAFYCGWRLPVARSDAAAAPRAP
ncbi:hypothetical protein CDD83_10190 [Cordyceps sp. RAO-2017]|nr:hypothetical protein CDD83_10190 [Cordyceps sp. RAO-2017]